MASNPLETEDTHLKQQYETLQQKQQEKLMKRKLILEKKHSKQGTFDKSLTSKQGTAISEAFGVNDELNLTVSSF